MSAGQWCLIESDPGVFTELIANIGVRDVQVEELYSLDEESLHAVGTAYGLIFLFKYEDDKVTPTGTVANQESLFFASQVIQNACATQAILSVLLNCPPTVDIGAELSQFKAFASGLPPAMRGLAISNSDTIRDVHNSFARSESFSSESRKATKDDDLFHFVAYIPFQGRLYELDGLQRGPIDHGECSMENWLFAAAPVISARIERYAATEIRFNLMTIIRDVRVDLDDRKAELEAQLLSLPEDDSSSGLRDELQQELEAVSLRLHTEDAKRARYRMENIRRKHNYIPFIVEALKALARHTDLTQTVEAAKQTAAQRAAAHRAAKQSAK
eukprot:m.99531 g.99531  ORF g.99531 m.99531 type:complete len:329 (-) comp51443_c0_seq4:85-1071(-)